MKKKFWGVGWEFFKTNKDNGLFKKRAHPTKEKKTETVEEKKQIFLFPPPRTLFHLPDFPFLPLNQGKQKFGI
jgi:hypothetical protein